MKKIGIIFVKYSKGVFSFFFYSVKKLAAYPIFCVLIFTIISILIYIPSPFAKQRFWFPGDSDGWTVRVDQKVELGSKLNVVAEVSRLPIRLKYYDLIFHVKKLPEGSNYSVDYVLEVTKDKDIYEYIENSLRHTVGKYPESSNTYSNFVLNEGDRDVVSTIPIDTRVIFSGMMWCNTLYDNAVLEKSPCWSNLKNSFENVEVFVRPNLISLIVQYLLVFAFWIILIDSLLGIIHKRWRLNSNLKK